MRTLKEIRMLRLMAAIELRIKDITAIIKFAANDYYIDNINHRAALNVYRNNIKSLMYYSRVYQNLAYSINEKEDLSKEMFIEVTTLIKFFEC